MRKTMTKTNNRDTKSANGASDVKKRKKQAKKEAQLMLQIAQAKKDVEKSHQKIAKDENVLQQCTTRLNELENQLAQLQNSGKVSPRSAAELATVETGQAASGEPEKAIINIESDASGESYKDNEAIITQHREEQEPAEGRTDIPGTQQEPSEGTTDIPVIQYEQAKGRTAITVAQQEPAEGRTDIPEAQQEPAEGHTAITVAQQEPAEGRTDITETEQQPVSTSETSTIASLPTDEQVITSGEGSIPIVTSDEHAWPPPNIREELAEGIVEQTTENIDANKS
jgi:hypothetical protein